MIPGNPVITQKFYRVARVQLGFIQNLNGYINGYGLHNLNRLKWQQLGTVNFLHQVLNPHFEKDHPYQPA